MDALFLARLQLARMDFISFFPLSPSVSPGSWSSWKVWAGVRTTNCTIRVEQFLGKLLALTFAVGVAAGIVMEFQFGTNWANVFKICR